MLPRIDCHRQHGVVLVVLVTILGVMALGWLYGQLASRHRADQATARALAVAQAALTGRAVADINHPGSLPCPDTNNDGVAETTVGQQGGGCPGYIGRVPWRTLGLSDVRDGVGERLWYALSSDTRDAQYLAVNSQTAPGVLQVNGNGQLVAVLLSSDVALASQSRDQTNENVVADFLEGDNANGDNVYEAQTLADASFNDKLLVLSSAGLFRKVERLILQQMVIKLAQYAGQHNAAYPFAADASGNAQPNQLNGFVPYLTLKFAVTDPLVKNNWFTNLAPSPLLPYNVTVGLNKVHINLTYCYGDMAVTTPMVVQCD